MSNLRNERDFSLTAADSLETRAAELANAARILSKGSNTPKRSAPKRIQRKSLWQKLITFSFR